MRISLDQKQILLLIFLIFKMFRIFKTAPTAICFIESFSFPYDNATHVLPTVFRC